MVTTTKVRGVEELVAKINTMSNESDQIMSTAVVFGANVVKNSARGKVPKVTRTLERSIHPDELVITGSTVTIEVGTDVEYARRIELGFIGDDSLGRTFHQAGQPYLQPALDEARPIIGAKIGRAIRAMLIAKAIGGGK